jgi:hypothetical protein
MKPMLSKRIITEEDSAALFSNLQLLMGVNEELLRQLLQAKRDFDLCVSPRDEAANQAQTVESQQTNIGKAFLQMVCAMQRHC